MSRVEAGRGSRGLVSRAGSRGESLRDDPWIRSRDLQQRLRGSDRPAPPLLPVLKCRYTHTDHQSELRLRPSELLADCANVDRPNLESAARLHPAATDLPSLPDTGNQLREILGPHRNSSCTSLRRTRSCCTGAGTPVVPSYRGLSLDEGNGSW